MNEIRDRIRETPQDIRVLCPRGHFIADMWLEVPDGSDAIAMSPRGPHKRYVFNRLAGFYGFRMSLAQRRAWEQPDDISVTLACTNSRCAYTGKFRYTSLALQLATAALTGQREYLVAT